MSGEVEHSKKFFLSLTRKTIYASFLACILLPAFSVAGYGSSSGSKGIFFITVLSSMTGCVCGWFLLQYWEKKMQRSVTQLVQSKIVKIHEPPPHTHYEMEIQELQSELEKTKIGYEHQINLMQSSVAKSKDEVHQLHLEMDRKLEEMRIAYLEFEDLRQEYRRLEEEASHLRMEGEKSVLHKDSLISEYQRTISEQRMVIEKKQRYIAKLEGKVRDLMYEIRSLLQLETPPKGGPHEVFPLSDQVLRDDSSSTPYSSPKHYDFFILLQKYIEKAETLTGVDHLGYIGGKSPRFLDLSLDCYAIDRRRLFDSFKDETAGAVFIYSLPEKKFLFINQAIKTWTGWSQEKFMKEFPRLVARGYQDWEEALSKIKMTKECSTKLFLLNKVGEVRPFDCYMGMITKGPFAQNVIGILSSPNP